MTIADTATAAPPRSVTFTVLGVAAPQGSKKLNPIFRGAKGSPDRQFVGTRVGDDNPKTMPWRQDVAARAREAMLGAPQLLRSVILTVVFEFPRPKSHYRTGRYASELRADAPRHVATKPDLSKLVRAIEDAMTGIVWRDDSQVAAVRAMKVYSDQAPCARIVIQEMLK
jgi:Holliday junction resolvase RusA-like endonuclease